MKLLTKILFLFILTTTSLLADTVKKDLLRVEFTDNDGVETYDLNREYFAGNKRLLVQVKPQKVDEENKDEDKPDIVWKIDVQAGTVSVISNFSQIPNDIGTEFNLDGKTIANYRLYLSSIIKNKHEIRFLYAPLQYEVGLRPETDITFKDSIFLAGVDTDALYKFNSYRLSYIYHFDKMDNIQFRLGFTGKIRDAETALSQQNGSQESFTDLGFVPLIHLGAKIQLSKKLILDAEVEGSWAPQGYAVDTRLSLGYQLTPNLNVGAGVGYLDGGADVPTVNTFAQLFYGYGRITYTIPTRKKKKKKKIDF